MVDEPRHASIAMPILDEATSLSLIERARVDDPIAWQRIVRIYGPLVYGWGRKAGLQPNDASDVVQEVFASVAKGLGRFRKQSMADSFRGWLWTICRNKIRDHFRRLVDAPQAIGGTTANLRLQTFEDRPEPFGPEGHAESRQLRLDAMKACSDLFESQVWEAFWQVAVDGHAPAEVARDLGVSVWAVYKAKSRVLQRLRHELDGLVVLEAC